ncbi:hypothetical protein [Kitasatospora camelliae]|uniref:DUF4232 domain-containing protein n=1 Tax=Kitasatospora camelliae TaxID=3156397 RepID=A0AAU8JZ83_9ACTN
MTARRLTSAAVLGLTAVLALSGCGGGSKHKRSSRSHSSSTHSTTDVDSTARPAASSSATSRGCATSRPRGDERVIHVTAADGAKSQLTATDTRHACGPSGDRYEPTGAPVQFTVTPQLRIRLLAKSGTAELAQDVTPFSKLAAHVTDCGAKRTVAAPFSCHGNNFQVTVDTAGRITAISEVPA